jgi:hypothetical protein
MKVFKWLKSPRVIGRQYKLTTVFSLAKFHQKANLKVKSLKKKGFLEVFSFQKGEKTELKVARFGIFGFHLVSKHIEG